MRQNERRQQVGYIGLVVALVVLGIALSSWQLPEPLLWPFLFLLALVAEWAAPRFPAAEGRPGGAAVVAIPATALGGLFPGAGLGALAGTLWQLLRNRQEKGRAALPRALWDGARLFIAYALAGVLFRELTPFPLADQPMAPWPTAGFYLPALLLFWGVDLLLDYPAFRMGKPPRQGFLHTALGNGETLLAAAPVGILVVLTYPLYGPAGTALAVAPLPALHAALRASRRDKPPARDGPLVQVLRFAETLRSDLNLDLLLDHIVRLVNRELGFGLVLLGLYREEKAAFFWRTAWGVPPEEMEQLNDRPLPRDRVFCFFDDRYRVDRCYHLREETAHLWPEESGSLRPWWPEEVLLVPLIAWRGELIGVLLLGHPPGGRFPDLQGLRILEILSNQAAQAIESASLYAELRERLLALQEANQQARQAHSELARYANRLEEMVAQRTRELEVALERATESERLKSEFLASMSHELRTPLNSIIGFSRVILKEMDGPLTDLQRTDLTAIYNSGVHLLSLINDILDLSKIEAGRLELHKEAVDLAPVVRGVLNTCTPLVEGKPVELRSHFPPDLPPVYADPTRLRQIILNLVSNAIKFTEEGSVTVQAHPKEGEVVVSIQDTGVGIDPKNLDKVFQPFWQGGRKIERRLKGTGLGLTISQRFVEMHGGRIWAESEPGQGTTVFFTLPVMGRPYGVEMAAPVQAEVSGAGRPLLVVDDDPDVVTLFRHHLEPYGYQVLGAADAVEALRLTWEAHPYAVALNLDLPEADGWTVLRALQEDATTQEIPLIAYSDRQEKEAALRLGAAEYMEKPPDPTLVLEALERLCCPPRRVVVIESDPEVLSLVRTMVEEREGYTVIVAATGEEDLEAVAGEQPDLVLLGLTSFRDDRWEVLARLREDHRTRHIPVIGIVQEPTPETRAFLEERGVTFLVKGQFTAQDLWERMAQALEGSDGQSRRGDSPERQAHRAEGR